MKCPACDHLVSKCAYTMKHEDGVWRKRECLNCSHVFWTKENVAEVRKGIWSRRVYKRKKQRRYAW